MSSAVVCDASALVAMLLRDGEEGRWATSMLLGSRLVAPALVGFECANIVRRQEQAGLVSSDLAAEAHRDLLDLTIEQWPYEVLATRAWQLRHNLSSYDAAYVALAEYLHVPLVTLDRRLAGAPRLACEIVTP